MLVSVVARTGPRSSDGMPGCSENASQRARMRTLTSATEVRHLVEAIKAGGFFELESEYVMACEEGGRRKTVLNYYTRCSRCSPIALTRWLTSTVSWMRAKG